jgi:hypothetical protein
MSYTNALGVQTVFNWQQNGMYSGSSSLSYFRSVIEAQAMDPVTGICQQTNCVPPVGRARAGIEP